MNSNIFLKDGTDTKIVVPITQKQNNICDELFSAQTCFSWSWQVCWRARLSQWEKLWLCGTTLHGNAFTWNSLGTDNSIGMSLVRVNGYGNIRTWTCIPVSGSVSAYTLLGWSSCAGTWSKVCFTDMCTLHNAGSRETGFDRLGWIVWSISGHER